MRTSTAFTDNNLKDLITCENDNCMVIDNNIYAVEDYTFYDDNNELAAITPEVMCPNEFDLSVIYYWNKIRQEDGVWDSRK